VSAAFRFETFVDVHSNIFNEYLGSVIAEMSRENEEYRAVRADAVFLNSYNMELLIKI
jgi:hypothetical protein